MKKKSVQVGNYMRQVKKTIKMILLLPKGGFLLVDKESSLPFEPSEICDKGKYSQI